MSIDNNPYGSLSLSTLKKLRSMLPRLRKHQNGLNKFAQANREKMEKHLPPDFTWSELYDLSVRELNILGLAVMGLLAPLCKAAREGLNLNEFVVEEAILEMNSVEDGE